MNNSLIKRQLFMLILSQMVLQSSGAISFTNLQTEFGGANPIGFDEYYANNASGYTSGVSGIPNSGTSISLNQFYGKTKVVSGISLKTPATAANMDTTGGSMFVSGDDTYAAIDILNFSFKWYGVECGYNNTIYWNTNHALTFNTANTSYSLWSPGSANGLLLGQYDRFTNSAYTFNPTSSNGYQIKRFIVFSRDYSGGGDYQFEIRLLNNGVNQFIEFRISVWNYGPSYGAGLWQISNGGSWQSLTSGTLTNQSFVMIGNLNGDSWAVYNNYSIY